MIMHFNDTSPKPDLVASESMKSQLMKSPIMTSFLEGTAKADQEPVPTSSEPSTLTKHVTTLFGDLGLAERVTNETIHVGDILSKTHLLARIGGGSFGEIYLGQRLDTGQKVAVKVELQHPVNQYLLNEGNIYRKLEGTEGIPRVLWYGLHGAEYAMMIMDLLGSTIYQMWVQCGSKFSLKTVLMLIDQMLVIIEKVHKQHIVHRDISVNNFMLGSKDQGHGHQVHLIDFGHARKIDPSPRLILGSRNRKISHARPMVGTPRFSSVFTHMGHEVGFRDDLESLAYVWIYLLKGKLPWQGQRLSPGESKLERIAFVKLNTRLETLCDGLPEEFLVYMNYVRRLKPTEMPDHGQLRELFKNLASAQNIQYDFKFDWVQEKCHSSALCNRG